MGLFELHRSHGVSQSWHQVCFIARLALCPILLLPFLPRLFFPAAAAESLQLCPTLCDPIGGSPPGSSIPGILPRPLLLSNQLRVCLLHNPTWESLRINLQPDERKTKKVTQGRFDLEGTSITSSYIS